MTATNQQMQLLQVLSALEENSDRAQRAIALATGLSLGKVNFCLKKLVDKGHVKLRNVARNPNKLGYLYLLTPEGVRAKSQLTYEYVRIAAAQFNHVYARVSDCISRIAASGAKEVIFFGAGDVAEVCHRALMDQRRLRLGAVVDERRQGTRFRGFEVRSEGWLLDSQSTAPVLVCEPEVLSRARKVVGEERLHVLR